ncbi:hypothetical protein Q8G47_27995, partial [Klebsiella pneumoniae]|uniref:hypothetical protein n=1 Tax=Klebsiella pneumoniae TaxID=573 RepID=UPI0030138902
MYMGRGSAVAALMMVLCLVVLQYEVAQAATYTVGGVGGWTFNTVRWPDGKRFRAGDVLVFKYDPTIHNVVIVDKGAYRSCSTPSSAKVLQSGNDQIKLAKGQNFFICNFPGHCESGMKIAVSAA